MDLLRIESENLKKVNSNLVKEIEKMKPLVQNAKQLRV